MYGNFDAIDRSIDSLKKRASHLTTDQVLFVMEVLEDWFSKIDPEVSIELNEAEKKLKEAVMWLQLYGTEP